MREEIEIMRILRQPPLGKLAVQVNQQRYEQLADIPDKTVRQLLETAVGELIAFVGGYQKLVDAGVAPPLTTIAPSPTAKNPASTNIRPLSAAPATPQPASSLNIIDGINTILNRHLASTPSLANRSVKLSSDPAGGLRIEVDGQYYQRPDELEDKEIKTLLQQALKEWEKN